MLLRTITKVILISIVAFPLWAGRTKLTDAQRAWLDQVDPIITNDERKEFKRRLNTERERAQFMELFWAKRDPDLADSSNPFKREYLARLDYALTHFEGPKATTPQTAMGRVFLLLGKPDREETRIDYSITGTRYRNPFPGRPAILWVYENPGYEFPRDEIRIQFVPTTVFGDYNALSDQIVWHHLRTIKFKFIMHPDLEEAPLLADRTVDFQDGTGITGVDVSVPVIVEAPQKIDRKAPGEIKPEQIDDPALAQQPPQKIDRKAPGEIKPEQIDDPALAQQPPQKIDRKAPGEIKPEQVDDPALAQQPPQKIDRKLPGEIKPEQVDDPALAQQPPQKIDRKLPGEIKPEQIESEPSIKGSPPPKVKDPKAVEQVALNVPPVTSEVGGKPNAPRPATGFQATAGNEMQLAGSMATLKRDRDRSMVLGRLGFPLKSLTFDYHSNVSQYAAPMQLQYIVEDQNGKAILSDRVVREILLDDLSILERRNPYFTREFAAILPPGRYQLKMELFNQRTQQRAYAEETIDVINYQTNDVSLSQLRILDPNVNPEEAKFQIDSEPMGLKLGHRFERGERIYPFIELVNGPDINQLGMLAFELVTLTDEVLQTWELFPEEVLPSPQQTLYISPELRLRDTPPGRYTLRFVWDADNGDSFIRETPITVE